MSCSCSAKNHLSSPLSPSSSSSHFSCAIIDIDPLLPAASNLPPSGTTIHSYSSSCTSSSCSLSAFSSSSDSSIASNGDGARREGEQVEEGKCPDGILNGTTETSDAETDKNDDDNDDQSMIKERSGEGGGKNGKKKEEKISSSKRRMNGSDGNGMNHETSLHEREPRGKKTEECSGMMDGVRLAHAKNEPGKEKEEEKNAVKEKQKKNKGVCLEGKKKKPKEEQIKNKNEDKVQKSEQVGKEERIITNGHANNNIHGNGQTEEDTNSEAIEGDEVLPLLLANRSAVYLHLKHFDEAVNDINEAIGLGYQILDNHNIVTRKITCLKFLGRDAEAETLYRETISLINREIPSERVRLFWVEKLTSALNQIVPVLSINSPSNVIREDKTLTGRNQVLPSASDFVQINYEESKGRHLKVTKHVSVGEVLIIDKPIGSVLANKFYGNYCNHCMVQLTNHRFIPCIRCELTKYCSIVCRNESWRSYHSKECPYLPALRLYPNGLHLLRILISCDVNECIQISLKGSPKLEIFPKIGMRRDFESFHSLLPKEMDSPEFNICYPLASAIYALICLRMNLIARDQLLIMASKTIISSLLKISRNADTIFTHDFNLIIGSAVHTTSAMFNHDCDPNVYSYYLGNKVIHVAKKEICVNSEINVSYGVNYAFDPLVERQEFLSKSFLFECNCKRCRSEKAGNMICFNCKGPLMKTTFETIACPSCDVTNDPSDSMLLDPDHFIVNQKSRNSHGGDHYKGILNWSIFNYCSIM